jgi:uncharacterized surface anchored protein
MYRRLVSIALIIIMLSISLTTAYATPPAHPHIGSGTNADGGFYFQYYGSSGTWKDLNTPPHWVVETGEVAYCVDHEADSPSGNETYTAFNPQAFYSSTTYYGLLAILKAGYPYQTGGLSAKQARYATANAIRAWLSESAGIGYNFMKISRGYVRPISGQEATYNFMVYLVNKARNNQQPVFSISTNPGNVKLDVQDNKLVGQVTIIFSNINGYYSIDNSKLPSGVTISGYTGKNGDVLTISAPTSYAGQTLTLSNLFEAHDTRASSNMYWFETNGDEQPVLVPVTDTTKPVARGSLTFNSDGLGYIEIIKKDAVTNVDLSGAVFGIYDSSDQEVTRLTTGSNGHAVSGYLVLGTYSVKEITAPQGYVLNTNVFGNISVTPNNTTTVTVSNQPQVGIIEIVKQDSETGNTPQGDATLAGTVFEIYNTDGELIQRLECGENENVISDELLLGEYIVKEVEPPSGYLLNPNEYLVSIEYSNQTIEINSLNISIPNDVIKGSIAIDKFADVALAEWNSDNPKPPLGGVEFEIRLKSDGVLYDTLITDADGKAQSLLLPYGVYTVTETRGIDGYRKCVPFDVVVDENGKVYSYAIENEVYRSQVKIVKVDDATGEVIPIAGAQFKIKDSNGDFIVQSDTDIYTTDNSGTITLPQPLIYGDYTLYEIAAPYGYWLNETPLAFSVDDSGENLLTIEFGNALIQKRIRVIKTDERDNERGLQGAVFNVYRGAELAETLTTNEDGTATTKLLPVGDYRIIEVQAPIGFVLDDLVLNVTISDDETQVFTVIAENRPTEVIITKTDIADDASLPNAHIEIYNVDDELVFESNTNENGELIIQELPVGKYIFTETIAPEGYILNKTVFEFEILENGEILGVTNIQDTATEVTLYKTDITTGLPLPNAEIEILNIDGESVFKGKTDENGEITIAFLPIGSYTFIETKAPDGYILSIEELAFSIDELGVVAGKTELDNSPTALHILKVKYEDNAPLSGAGFKVKNWFGLKTLSFTLNDDGTYRYDADGEVKEILVDENGEAVVYGIPFGAYWLEESLVPAGYFPSAPVKITIGETNNIDIPFEAVIPNSVFVKLGLDRDRYNVPIAISITLLTLAGLVFFLVRRKRKKGKS